MAGFLVVPFLTPIAGLVIVLVFGGIFTYIKQIAQSILSW